MSPTLSDELVLGIFECLADADLLSLATVSKHIHDVALMTHLGRYGITETDIQAGSFQCTSGAVCALRTARFITRIETLNIRFESSTTLDRDIAALAGLARRLPPIKSVDLEWPPDRRKGRRLFLESLLLDLVSYRSQPAIIVSPGREISVVRPRRPTLYAVQRLLARLRFGESEYCQTPEPEIDETELRQPFIITNPPFRATTRVSIRVFPLSGSLIVLFPQSMCYMDFRPNIRRAEVILLFNHLSLPFITACIMDSTCAISDPALHLFFCRHPRLRTIRLYGDPSKETVTAEPLLPLPSGSLPQLESIHGSACLLSWVLASPQACLNLAFVTLELYPRPGMRNYYGTALRRLALRPTARQLVLQFTGWVPWNTPEFATLNAPERTLFHVAESSIKPAIV
ncbi:hypothetical protein MSAN_01077500 [Mycena sanguinolenta]|uniref:F-box domain-containing protein n=1 Tax=Mycena sanguinolenta TaxID=230812 RepID=A0A8H7D971_9AGAR|nr:hypothetical protein MSAN_01077500 [Mycena sanguinolenta]